MYPICALYVDVAKTNSKRSTHICDGFPPPGPPGPYIRPICALYVSYICELGRTRSELALELGRTRSELGLELGRTRSELGLELGRTRSEGGGRRAL